MRPEHKQAWVVFAAAAMPAVYANAEENQDYAWISQEAAEMADRMLDRLKAREEQDDER